MRKDQPIGVFDSGSGGISVLRAFRRVMPQEDYFYFGDHQNLPYGEKKPEQIRALTVNACDAMADRGLKAMVIACNSASTAALDILLARYPFPVLGVEPAVAQAAALPGRGLVLVMATTATLASQRFKALSAPFGDRITPLPCPGLVELIEAEDASAQDAYLRRLFLTVRKEDVDALVLGCTHYPLIKDSIVQTLQKSVPVIDGYERRAENLYSTLKNAQLHKEPGQLGHVMLASSGGPETTARLERFLMGKPSIL